MMNQLLSLTDESCQELAELQRNSERANTLQLAWLNSLKHPEAAEALVLSNTTPPGLLHMHVTLTTSTHIIVAIESDWTATAVA